MTQQPVVQAPSKRSKAEQHLIHSALTWEEFETL